MAQEVAEDWRRPEAARPDRASEPDRGGCSCRGPARSGGKRGRDADRTADPDQDRPVRHPGKVVFRSKESVLLEPGGPVRSVTLEKVPGAEAAINTQLLVVVVDADDEEVLDQGIATLKVELDEWS